MEKLTRRVSHQRVAPELMDLARRLRARALLNGQKPPSMQRITRAMVKKTKERELFEDVFFKV